MSDTRHLVWYYGKGGWTKRLPSLGGDEDGYRTFVLPLPGKRALVFSLYRCKCEDCAAARAQTARFEVDIDRGLDLLEEALAAGVDVTRVTEADFRRMLATQAEGAPRLRAMVRESKRRD